MTPKCGRVEYVRCLFHTCIGLGKWTHDPTLLTNYESPLKEALKGAAVGPQRSLGKGNPKR